MSNFSQPKKKTSKLAIAGLILSICGFVWIHSPLIVLIMIYLDWGEVANIIGKITMDNVGWYFGIIPFLVIPPILGTIAILHINKNKEKLTGKKLAKISFVISIFSLLTVLFYWFTSSEVPGPSEDATRKAEMRQLITAQDIYHKERGEYLSVPGCISVIDCYPESFVSENKIIMPITPSDPINEEPYIYKGLNNESDTQKFCYYAKLKDKEPECAFYTASHKGNFCKKEEPKSLNDCAKAD